VKIRFAKERMLLGDPQRVYNYPPANAGQPTAQVAPQVEAPAAAVPAAATTVSQTDSTPTTPKT
jgi:hypothetical protein